MSDDDVARYHRAAHAMQSALAAEIGGTNLADAGANAKHLRVGLNSCLVDTSAMAGLLMAKGLITRDEYVKAVADAMETEADRCAKRTRERLGLPETVTFV